MAKVVTEHLTKSLIYLPIGALAKQGLQLEIHSPRADEDQPLDETTVKGR